MAAGPRKTKTAAPDADASVETSAVEAVETVTEAVEEPAPVVVEEVAKVQEATEKAAAKSIKTAAETVNAMEQTFTAAGKSLQAFSARALEAYRANAAASMEYVQALATARTVSEAIALQSEHMRKQYESLTTQAKELTALAQQVAADAAAPLKEQLEKAFKR
jgi:phasin